MVLLTPRLKTGQLISFFPSPDHHDSFITSEIVPAGVGGNKSPQVFLGQSVLWSTEESSRQTCQGTGFSLLCLRKNIPQKTHKSGRRKLTTN